jgi:hypothetical protein
MDYLHPCPRSAPPPRGVESFLGLVGLHRMRLIDVRHLGRERVIGCWEVDGVLVHT